MSRHRQPRMVVFTSEQTNPASSGSTVSTCGDRTKKDVLKIVANWWDDYKARPIDFDTLHIKFVSEKDNKND